MKNNKFYILIGLVGAVAFYVGFILQKNKKEIEQKAGEIALKQGLDYVKSESSITKDWFNQMGNTIKQAWK